ncbi:hypothetical protein BDV36DRAFT_264255 [Aspergillus pseudocaelatus]|uniref:Uncharacterized protein n=1 Tax=Aspergillus pseudocaelatus TaxID=1825620 RepID=A0ABQ6WE61_9EURO|nr:hypothetical protein BDV36DRAFT_264255 [Aspergillus pseudocaelatus]
MMSFELNTGRKYNSSISSFPSCNGSLYVFLFNGMISHSFSFPSVYCFLILEYV